MSKNLNDEPLSISHSRELFDAVSKVNESNSKCKILLVKGTKFGTTKGGIKAAADADYWIVTDISGSVETGYEFNALRIR